MAAHAAAVVTRAATAVTRRRVAAARRFATASAKGKAAPRVSPKFYEPKSPKVSVPPPPNPPGPFHEVRWGKAAWNGVLVSAAGAGLYWAYTKAVVPRVEGLVKGASAGEAEAAAAAAAAVPAGSSIVDLRPTATAVATDAPAAISAAAPAPSPAVAAAVAGAVSVGADGITYVTPTRTWWQFLTLQPVPQPVPLLEPAGAAAPTGGAGSSNS
jgi:hypothetical protein